MTRRLRSWFSSLPPLGVLSRMVEFRPWVQAIGVAVVLNLVVGVAWTYPRWNADGRDREEARQIAEADRLVGPALARARETYGCILTAEEDLRSLHGMIASRSGTTAEAVEAVRHLVEEHGLGVTQVTRQAEAIGELGLVELQTKLPVTGSYGSVRELIAALAREEGPFVAIDRIALSAPDDAGAGGRVAVELGLSTFVVEPGASPVAAGSRGTGSQGGNVDDDGATADASGGSVDDSGATAPIQDPWAVIDEVRERLESLPPLPIPQERYHVGISRLVDRPSHESSVSRNLFAFDAVEPPAPVETPPPTETPVTEPTPRRPPPPRVGYQLLGILEMPDGRRATLKDGDALYVVGVGERLPDDVEVVAVGVDYAELEVGGVSVRLTLKDGTP